MKLRASLIAAAIAMFAGTSAQAALIITDDFSTTNASQSFPNVADTTADSSFNYSGATVAVGGVNRNIGASLVSGLNGVASVQNGVFYGQTAPGASAQYDIVYTGAALTGTQGTLSLDVTADTNFGNPAGVSSSIQAFSGGSAVSGAYTFSSAPQNVNLALTAPVGAAGLTVRVSNGGTGFDIQIDNVRYSAGVPTPATAALIGLGLLGLARSRRRQV